MKMSRLDMFLIVTPMKFIEDAVTKKTNERLDVLMTTHEYIKWVGFLAIHVVLGWDSQ